MRKLNIAEIKTMGNRAVVESFGARVITVYKPTDPSPAQAEKSIHKQGVVVGIGEEKLSLTLNVPSLHMDNSFEGKMMSFSCTTNDKGQPVGMVINRWKKGDQDRVGVDVWGTATFHELTTEDKLPAPQQIPAGNMPEDPKDGIHNYMGFYNYVYGIVAEKMELTECGATDLKDITTHYMIGLQQRGALKDSIYGWFAHNLESDELKVMDLKMKNEDHGMDAAGRIGEEDFKAEDRAMVDRIPENTDSTPDPSDEATPWQEVKDSEGNIISQMGKDALIELCIKLIPFSGSEHPVIMAGFEAAMRSRAAMELSFADIYDVYEIMLNQNHDLEAIATAYGNVEGNPKLEVEEVCKRILSDQKTFVEIVRNHEPA